MGSWSKNRQYFRNPDWTAKKVREEIHDGLCLLERINKRIITVFGGHKVCEDNSYYRHCRLLAYELGKKGYAIMTGGGSGIMEAANLGAKEANALSIGIKAQLLKKEWVKSDIFTHQISLHFLFVRRFILAIKSKALIFYPGGFGTLNELFEFATLMKTGIVDHVPLICVNKAYWEGLFEWLNQKTLKEGLFNDSKKDLDPFYLVDGLEDLLNIIEKKSKH